MPLHRPVIAAIRRYHRLTIDIEAPTPHSPVLFVANHGFGSVFDLNVYATLAALDRLELDRPVTALVHQLGWRIGLGPAFEFFGGLPASPASLRKALGGLSYTPTRIASLSADSETGKSNRERRTGPSLRSPGMRHDARKVRRKEKEAMGHPLPPAILSLWC